MSEQLIPERLIATRENLDITMAELSLKKKKIHSCSN